MMTQTIPSPSGQNVTLIAESPLWISKLQDTLQAAANAALDVLLPHHPDYTAHAFTLVLADDTLLQSLNADWRDKNQPTNVLAFPAFDMPCDLDAQERTLGDVIMAFETAQKEAETLGIGLSEHSTHLMIHGLLHLLGHDHLTEDEQLDMENWEIRTMKLLGHRNPYE